VGIQAKRVSGVAKLSRKYKLDCVDLQCRSREGTKKRALENRNKTHKNYRVGIWAGRALLFYQTIFEKVIILFCQAQLSDTL
jgi:hypothetical protein